MSGLTPEEAHDLIGEGFDTIALAIDQHRAEIANCTAPLAVTLGEIKDLLVAMRAEMSSIVVEREHDREDQKTFRKATNDALASIRKSLPNGLKHSSSL